MLRLSQGMMCLSLSAPVAHSGLLTLLDYVPIIRNNPNSLLKNNIIYSSKISKEKKKSPLQKVLSLALGAERKHFGAKRPPLPVIFLFQSDKKIQMLSKITFSPPFFFFFLIWEIGNAHQARPCK